jgi:heme-degrading monooxygenase HmoA
MSVVKINAIAVPDGNGELLEQRFAERAHLVEGMPGFEGFELLRPVRGETRYFVVTHWRDDDSFQAWVGSDAFRQGHARSTDGAPIGGHASLLEFDVVDLVTTHSHGRD